MEGTLPPLSPNFQATQLLTPRQLERITIDQPHYHGHLSGSIALDKHPSKNALDRRVGKMGDNFFFLQRELPAEEKYQKTALQLSRVRPWDQIVQRPLHSANMSSKEVHLPFPQEHPYTSHISRCAVFPDTMNMVDVGTQTAGPPPLYGVSQKACEKGLRIETRYTTPNLGLSSGAGTLLWDIPRSRKHKRACTYPAPSQQFSRPSTAPGYLPLASTMQPAASRPTSQQALSKIHQLLTRTTTYSEQFSAPHTPRPQNVLLTAYAFRSRENQRPWTAESRGKYNRVPGVQDNLETVYSDYGDESEPDEVDQDDNDTQQRTEGQDDKDGAVVKVDAWTQTEEEYFSPELQPELPPVRVPAPRPYTVDSGVETPFKFSPTHKATPTTAKSTRRIMTLFNGFNKTEALRRFHGEFPGTSPDLRQYSAREGKRHMIHGSHAYYYH